MLIEKSKIENKFLKSINSYDLNASAQKIIIDKLLSIINTFPFINPACVLEIGCGTGLLTKNLSSKFCIDTLHLNDLVYELCQKSAKVANIDAVSCISGDFEELEFKSNYDLIISTSTFQWFHNRTKAFKKLANLLNESSFLVFSSFGTDNFKEIRSLESGGLEYTDLDKLKQELNKDFDLLYTFEENIILEFSSPLEILKHIKSTGVGAVASKTKWNPQKLLKFSNSYKQFLLPNGNYPLTYHPLYFVCQKR